MSFEEKPQTAITTKEQKKQWLWFFALWCLGLTSVAILSYGIRWIMGML